MNYAIEGMPTIVVLILLLGGIQLFIIGIIGEYSKRFKQRQAVSKLLVDAFFHI